MAAAATPPVPMKAYLAHVRAELALALCLRDWPSQTVERHNRPEVEDRASKELLLPPVTVARSERECVLIEPSINSARVSLRIKQADDMERLLVHKLAGFLQQRAEALHVLRRRPVPGYDLSFLITAAHLTALDRERVVDFIVRFMEGAWALPVWGRVWRGVRWLEWCCAGSAASSRASRVLTHLAVAPPAPDTRPRLCGAPLQTWTGRFRRRRSPSVRARAS